MCELWIGMALEVSGRGIILRYYPSFHLDGLRETTDILNYDSRTSGRDLNPGASLIRSRSEPLDHDLWYWFVKVGGISILHRDLKRQAKVCVSDPTI
jgi:hypothetical protein